MRLKVLLCLLFSFTAGTIGLASLAHAEDVSLWINTGTPTKTVLQGNIVSDVSEKYCDRHDERRIVYKQSLLYPFAWEYKQLEPVSACWYTTDFGHLGIGSQGAYLRFGDSGPVTIIDNPNYHLLYALGTSNKLAGSYAVGTQRYLYIYDDARQSFNFVHGGPYDKYTFRSGADTWTLSYPSTSLPLPMMRVGTSENGSWMVVEASGSFLRINTLSKEILPFEKSLYPYGYGQDPTYDLSISNDGRYAVIAGGNVVDRTNLMYDLSTCVVDVTKPLLPATGCGKRNIKADFFPQLTINQAAQRFIFSSDNENMTADVNEKNQWNRYNLTAPGKDYHGIDYLALGDSYSSGEGEYDGNYYMGGNRWRWCECTWLSDHNQRISIRQGEMSSELSVVFVSACGRSRLKRNGLS